MNLIKGMDLHNFTGNAVGLNRVNARHLNSLGQTGPVKSGEKASFADMLINSVNSVNTDQMEGQNLFQQMITNPDSVEVHEVTTAMAKAEMSMNLAKGILDRAVRAYKEIISLR